MMLVIIDVPDLGSGSVKSGIKQIRNPAIFLEIWLSQAPAEFLAVFDGCQYSCTMFS